MAEYICKEVPTDNGGYLEIKKELIRCRDCKWYDMSSISSTDEPITYLCKRVLLRDPDDFCKDAERKDNG